MTTNGSFQIRRADPREPALSPLLASHLAFCEEATPDPESRHVMDPDALATSGALFFVLETAEGAPVAMGALKALSPEHGEVKSMHTLAAARGTGAGAALVERLIAEGRALGFRRLSLETGSNPPFAAARRLYARAGFSDCGPFPPYQLDPNSAFMTRAL